MPGRQAFCFGFTYDRHLEAALIQNIATKWRRQSTASTFGSGGRAWDIVEAERLEPGDVRQRPDYTSFFHVPKTLQSQESPETRQGPLKRRLLWSAEWLCPTQGLGKSRSRVHRSGTCKVLIELHRLARHQSELWDLFLLSIKVLSSQCNIPKTVGEHETKKCRQIVQKAKAS